MTDWKSKLAAYLHDPPSKALDVRTHGERSDAAFRQAGFNDETEIGNYFRHADHTGAAADRLPFPKSQAAGLQCAFDGVRNTFRHPLSGEPLPFHAELRSVEEGFEGEQSVQPKLTDESLGRLATEELRWRARFFAHWRLWPKHAAEKDYRFGLLPADTRIPDHSIWTHMQVVSALTGCVGPDRVWRPAFLKFQLGPVQEFIAAARSIRDLWSGSYLLSWLMAAGLKALSERVGPAVVIFPNLRGQPLFDLHWKDELWSKVQVGGKTVWDSLDWDERDQLTPSLPNVFLAVVPADNANESAQHVADAIRAEWCRIAEAVWEKCDKAGLTEDEGNFTAAERKQRFLAQVKRFLSLSWQSTLWPDTLEAAMKLADGFADGTPTAGAHKCVQTVVDMAEKQMPAEHRDRRFYTDDSKTKLNNIGLGWSVIVARNSWELEAVRETRVSDAANTGGWLVGTFRNKDVLTGREEAVAGGEVWSSRCHKLGEFWPQRFKKPHWLGAPTLIKRLWDVAYLKPQRGLEVQRSPNTRGMAAHDPFAKDDRFNDEDQADDVENQPASEKYFAVVAFDGDEIGKWMSGERAPKFSTQLADYTDGSNAQRYGAKQYFEQACFGRFLGSRRALSPSYHLQYSEALRNFALLCVRPIVEAFDGRLVYAGGDDVLALLPADTALECARALRAAFRGSPNLKQTLRTAAATLRQRHIDAQRYDSKAAPAPYYQELATEGCLLDAEGNGHLRRLDHVDQQDRPIPFLVPGPEADCSVGVAIAHFKAPLQDVVRAAQTAEKRAKRKPDSDGMGRSAVAVTLLKRSGEIIEWGAKWDGGLELYHALATALDQAQLSAKFPHRFAELLQAYVSSSTPLLRDRQSFQPVAIFPVDDVIKREFDHCLSRQRGSSFPKAESDADSLRARLRQALDTYLQSLTTPGIPELAVEKRLQALIGLCQTVAFANRTAADETAPPAASTPSVPPLTTAESQPA